MVLAELTEPTSTLKGVGAERARQLARLGVETIGDLLLLAPNRYEDRSRVVSLLEAAQSGEGLVHATVVEHSWFPRGKTRVLKLIIRDDTGQASLACFGRDFLARTFPAGTEMLVFGQFSLRFGEIQATTFDARRVNGPVRPEGIVAVYPLTEGLNQKILRTTIRPLLERYVSVLDDPLPEAIRRSEELVGTGEALRDLHQPTDHSAVERALQRLRFEELFLFQLGLARSALHRRRSRRRPRPVASRTIMANVTAALPFSLTGDQARALEEILADMERPWPMSRLLHGDVGSGKTLVALLAAVHAVERRQQVALMVPTELLARQHARNAARLLSPAGVHVALALGGTTAAGKRALSESLAAGEVDLVVGTHALFSEGLNYANLGFVIIDEQHRFGVAQRERILSRGTAPDLLLMSATPIPRSLALTAFGDSEVTAIREMPPGRHPVTTRLARLGNEDRVYTFVHRELEAGHQAYFVYPAIEDGGTRGLRSATEMAGILQERFAPRTVGLAHGRLDTDDRADAMQRFQAGEIDVLVATSVVEVGVDVPNATVMVIEHAETFGLAALHQLRGRVGRGSAQSTCILVYREPLTEDATERLKVLYNHSDGFLIAEEDLRIRGPGELQGTRQAGFLNFIFADIRRDMALMIRAREYIAGIIRDDPDLTTAEHQHARKALTARREAE